MAFLKKSEPVTSSVHLLPPSFFFLNVVFTFKKLNVLNFNQIYKEIISIMVYN
jgi:hypothetical protein